MTRIFCAVLLFLILTCSCFCALAGGKHSFTIPPVSAHEFKKPASGSESKKPYIPPKYESKKHNRHHSKHKPSHHRKCTPVRRKKSHSSSSSSTSGLSGYYRNFYHVDYYAVVSTSTDNYVNFRWGPSTSFPALGIRYSGQEVHVISTNGTWSQVIDENTKESGFIYSSFLARKNNYSSTSGSSGYISGEVYDPYTK